MSERIANYCHKVDIGRVRKTNEDVALSLVNASGDALLLVCDGMGGHKRGDVAAKLACETLKTDFLQYDKFRNNLEVRSFLRHSIKKANKLIFAMTSENAEQKMGTTLTVAVIHKNSLFVVNIGDSRAYIIDDSVTRITEDDSYVNYLYKIGKISFEEIDTHPQRHILTNALGLFSNVSFDIDFYHYDNNRILLCSDGLYNSLSEEEMVTLVTTKQSVEEKCDLLIATANNNGGFDNCAVVLWEVSKK